MIPLDYGRSFVLGKSPDNEVRFWVESRTRIIDTRTGCAEDYIQAASCKSEHTFAAQDLFIADNYDFLPVFGPEWGLIFRRKAVAHDGYRSCLRAQDMWGGQICRLVEAPAARALTTAAQIRAATYGFEPIVGQTEIESAATGLRAILEYPVKTLNTHRARDLYQVDTGPVVLPDLTAGTARHVEAMRLAFVAWNAPDWADFVIETRVPVGSAEVYHYRELRTLPAANRLFALPA